MQKANIIRVKFTKRDERESKKDSFSFRFLFFKSS